MLCAVCPFCDMEGRIIMIELTGVLQTVAPGQDVLFNNKAVKSGCAEQWRGGSGQVVLTQPGRYLVTFSGNIAVPDGGTVGEVSLGLALQGEAMYGSVMRATPGATEAFFNVSAQHYVDVPRSCCGGACCQIVTVQNTGAAAVSVDNANITAVRVA